MKHGSLIKEAYEKKLVQSEDLDFKNSMQCENGAQYSGQVRKDNSQKDGYGIQIWPDGAKYSGYWTQDKTNGFGRYEHLNGDIYSGEWLNDVAHGLGIYHSSNG
jgi:hypothetical protein